MVIEETERELIESCRRGETNAFRALFERYKDKVYTIALRYSGDPATAQDIAQDTFLKLFDRIGTFRGEAGFESWLYRLVVNSCFDQKRRTRRLTPLLDGILHLLRAPGDNALDKIMRAEMAGQVKSAVQSLPATQRMVVVLRYTEGLSYERIAEIMDCSTGTIASRINRIHKVLERRLRGKHVGI